MSQILSLAARKAAQDAGKVAGAVGAFVLLIAVAIGVVPNLATQQQLTADAPTQTQAEPQTPTTQGPAAATETPETPAPEETPETTEPAPTQTAETATTPATETVADITPAPATPAPTPTNGSSTGVTVQPTLIEQAVDLSPFDPWLADQIFEQDGEAEILFASTAAPDSTERSLITAVSDNGVWADFSFALNQAEPISNVRIGFAVGAEQYYAMPRQLDYLVTRTASGLDRYTFTGQMREIFDLNNRGFNQTRMDGARVNLEVLVDPATGRVAKAMLSVASAS
jgi:hypothetical protein